MSAFGDGVDRLRNRRDRDDYEDGLLTVAEGLAEIIGLLRELALKTSEHHSPCAQPHPQDSYLQCIKAFGHDGMHTTKLGALWGDTYELSEPRSTAVTDGGNPRCQSVHVTHGQCVYPMDGHQHHASTSGGIGNPWITREEPPKACNHAGPVTDRGAFGVLRRTCSRNAGHDGKHTDGNGTEW